MLWASITLAMAVGLYESFALVYLAAICMVYLVGKLYSSRKIGVKQYLLNAGIYIAPMLVAVLLRSLLSGVITSVLGLPMSARSASGIKYWFMNDAGIILKDLIYRMYVRYFLCGKYFFGVRMLLISVVVFTIFIIVRACIMKKWSMLFYGAALLITPWILIPVELMITPYRAAQTLAFFSAFVWMLVTDFVVLYDFKPIFKKITGTIAVLLFMVIVFNQGYQLNKYFYFDTLKNDNDERVCTEIAYQIMRECDTSKPVVFVGGYEMPEALREWVYLPIGSEKYNTFGSSINLSNTLAFYTYVDNNYGYMLYEIGSQDPLNWMTWAATGETSQVYSYMEMLGFKFVRASKEMCEEATTYASDIPVWPAEGSITECEDYILVKLGK